MANATKDVHPKREVGAVTQRRLKALDLASVRQAALEPRLPAGLGDGLAADLQKLGAVVPGALVTRSAAKTATRSQKEALAQGHSEERDFDLMTRTVEYGRGCC